MPSIRRAVQAGRFYPADPTQLQTDVRRYLEQADPPDSESPPKAVVVPHAGYRFSGPVAAAGYRQLDELRDRVRRVVLAGPAHYVALQGVGVSSAEEFETPLGRIPVDREAVDDLLRLPQVRIADDAHQPEHSLEVQLPFLQTVLGEFQLLPLLVGKIETVQMAEVLERVWNGPETLIVISSDLSHFHEDPVARQIDQETSQIIGERRYDDLRGERACGYRPLGGLLMLAQRKSLGVKTLALANSADTGGPRDRVVGYGAYSVTSG